MPEPSDFAHDIIFTKKPEGYLAAAFTTIYKAESNYIPYDTEIASHGTITKGSGIGWTWPSTGNAVYSDKKKCVAVMQFESTIIESDDTINSKLSFIAKGVIFSGTISNYRNDGKIFNSIKTTALCQVSSIEAQTITLAPVELDVSSDQTVQAFTDSVDATGTEGVGRCGEKKIKLDENSPAFLSIVYDEDDPVT